MNFSNEFCLHDNFFGVVLKKFSQNKFFTTLYILGSWYSSRYDKVKENGW